MLGRVADQLYWMARYSERGENMARIVDVADRMMLTPQEESTRQTAWSSALEVAGATAGYFEKHGDLNTADVLHYLALDPDNPSSIYASIRATRENARALRGTITTEMFESINSTWLELESMESSVLDSAARRPFFDWVKERAHLFRGVAEGTMLHDESTYFMDAGVYIERADCTARLLDSKYHILLPSTEAVGGAVDYYQWGALLRSLSAFRAYHKIYRDRVSAGRVAELIILNPQMPRSLRYCYDRLDETLHELCGTTAPDCQRIAGGLHARLRYRKISEVFETGLHEFLTECVETNALMGQQLERDFMMVR